MKRTLLACLFLMSFPAWCAEKDSAVSNYLSVMQKLQQLARENRDSDPQPKLRAAIDSALPDKLSSMQLYRLGVGAALIAHPQEAGADIPYDGVFAYASHRCAELLSTRADADSARYLRSMKAICGPDGGEGLLYRGLIERQEKLQKSAGAR